MQLIFLTIHAACSQVADLRLVGYVDAKLLKYCAVRTLYAEVIEIIVN
jgi:hypothetical protein